MKNLILTLACACMALALMALAPRPDVSTSVQTLKNKSAVVDPSKRVDKATSKSLHQFMQERKLTPDDNRLMNKSPRRTSAEVLSGTRIAVMDAQALDGFDNDGGCVLSETVYGLGWGTNVVRDDVWDVGPYKYYLIENFYGRYELPLEFNEETGDFSLFSCYLEMDTVSKTNGRQRRDTITTTIVFTLDDFLYYDGSMLSGECFNDGSVFFDGGILFYTEKIINYYIANQLRSTDTLAYITPVISSIYLLQPNGIHECVELQETESSSTDPYFIRWTDEMVYQVQRSYYDISRIDIIPGGGVHNPPATTFGSGGLAPKPIDPRRPRPRGGASTFNMASKGSDDGDTTPNELPFGMHLWGEVELVSFGRTFDPTGSGGHSSTPIDPGKRRLPILPGGGKKYSSHYDSTGSTGDAVAQTIQAPVYIFQIDDSTLFVYNLFNLGSAVNGMLIHENGTMTLPGQALFFDEALNDDFCNYSLEGDSLQLGNSGIVTPDTISWDTTVPHGLLHSYSKLYENNRLYFTNGNQFVLPAPSIRRGDVNRNGEISIGDVTALINALLSGESEDGEGFSWNNANVNRDDKLSIADVTVLINYLLSGNWPD